MRGSREISLVSSLHRASTDALIHNLCMIKLAHSCANLSFIIPQGSQLLNFKLQCLGIMSVFPVFFLELAA